MQARLSGKVTDKIKAGEKVYCEPETRFYETIGDNAEIICEDGGDLTFNEDVGENVKISCKDNKGASFHNKVSAGCTLNGKEIPKQGRPGIKVGDISAIGNNASATGVIINQSAPIQNQNASAESKENSKPIYLSGRVDSDIDPGVKILCKPKTSFFGKIGDRVQITCEEKGDISLFGDLGEDVKIECKNGKAHYFTQKISAGCTINGKKIPQQRGVKIGVGSVKATGQNSQAIGVHKGGLMTINSSSKVSNFSFLGADSSSDSDSDDENGLTIKINLSSFIIPRR